MKKLIFVLIGIPLFLSSCAYGIRYDGTYNGKIIDADTREPLEGVVILGTWYTAQFSPAGATHNYYDASETVTDNNGEFSISGKGLRVLSNLEPMRVTIFKSGYEYIDYSWETLKGDRTLGNKIKWEGSSAIISLEKLTLEQRRKQGTPDFYIGERYDKKQNITHSCLPKNIKLLPKEVNKELLEQGREPYDLEAGWCDK